VQKLNIVLTAIVIGVVATGCASSGAGTSTAGASARTNPNLISTAEIDANNLRDGYEIVQRLRPNWLTLSTSTVASMSGSAHGNSIGGVVVYLDNAKLGGPDVLRDISASTIGTIQYMDAATATATLTGLGSDVITGAIVVHSRIGH
jgi:hypothetical protein